MNIELTKAEFRELTMPKKGFDKDIESPKVDSLHPQNTIVLDGFTYSVKTIDLENKVILTKI